MDSGYSNPVITVPSGAQELKVPPKEEKKKESRGDGPARVIVKAPSDGSVTVEGQPLTLDGTQQTFNSPTLKAGHTYTYTFKVQAVREGRTFTRTENVTVRAGSESFVDLSELTAEESRPARVTVLLPADAKLYVDKVRCPLTSEKRSFETPALQASRTYYYTIRAEVVREGRTITISERASLTAGKHVVVDLNEKLTVQAARR